MKKFSELMEKSGDTAVFTFGRLNPPTTGHGKLIDAMGRQQSKNAGSKMHVFVSHSQDAKKNPLDYKRKVAYIRKMFPKYAKNITTDKSRTIFEVAVSLHNKGYKSIVMVVGSDRVGEFEKLLNQYNGVKSRHGYYGFDNIEVVSAGERDPDAEGLEGMSASKMRKAAMDGDLDSFKQGVPANFKDAEKLYKDVRKSMGIREEKDMGEMDTYEEMRDDYLTGKIWNVGEIVEANGMRGEIVRKGTNYISFMTEDNKVHKAWLSDITEKKVSGPDVSTREGRRAWYTERMRRARASGHPNPNMYAAQAALETGWGKSPSAKFNFVGMKARKDQEGETKKTTEIDKSGKKVKTKAKFAAFDSEEDSIKQHGNEWKGTLTKTINGKQYSYASDKNYLEPLSNILKMYGNTTYKPTEREVATMYRPKTDKSKKKPETQKVALVKRDTGDMNNISFVDTMPPEPTLNKKQQMAKKKIDSLPNRTPAQQEYKKKAQAKFKDYLKPKKVEPKPVKKPSGVDVKDPDREVKRTSKTDVTVPIKKILKTKPPLVRPSGRLRQPKPLEPLPTKTIGTHSIDKLKPGAAGSGGPQKGFAGQDDKKSKRKTKKLKPLTKPKTVKTLVGPKDSDELNEVSWFMKAKSKIDQMSHPKGYEKMIKKFADGMKDPKHKKSPSAWAADVAREYNVNSRGFIAYINKLIDKGVLPKELKAEVQSEMISFKSLVNKINEVKQDPDIKDMPGTQPAKYHSGVKSSVKDDRERHFKAKKAGPAPGDKGATTKPSVHTKKYKRMYGEVLDKDADIGDYVKDFKKSDAPQFKGKSDKKKHKMAVAAYLSRNEALLDRVDEILTENGHTDVASMKTKVAIAYKALEKMQSELSKLGDEDDLPTWWTNKVATAVSRIDDMSDYLDTRVDEEYEDELNEWGEIEEDSEYQGRKVKLNKPMAGDVKKSKVYVKNEKGNVVKVEFGDPNMTIKKHIPARRKSFRARHNCDNPGPKWKARYWSCKAW